MSPVELELIDRDTIGVRFPFDSGLVSQIRGLRSRRWNPKDKRWEVHLAHLAEVMKIFYIHPDEAPREAIDLYRDRWIRQQLRVETGNTLTRLNGSAIPVEKIDKATSFPVQGHQYSAKFIEGAWDGRRHLFDRRDMSFPTGLLPAVEKILRDEKIAYEVADSREESAAEFTCKGTALQLRDYQKEAVQHAIKRKRGVLEMATGSGKTLVAARIIALLRRRALFFVHTKDLLYQARRLLGAALRKDIGQVGDGVIDLKPITVATFQTVVRAFGKNCGRGPDEEDLEEDLTPLGEMRAELIERIQSTPVVFFDECHHLPAETCYFIALQTLAADHRFGLSATPYRADRHDLMIEAALGPKIFRVNCSRLIDLGHLVPPVIRFHKVEIKSARRDHSSYPEVYRRWIVEHEARNRLVASEARRLAAEGKSVLVLVNEIRHGELLRAAMPEARFIQGADSAQIRCDALADLEAKKLSILIATTLADEGLDVPSLDAVVLAGAGRSETRALQRVGRALRPAEGKKKAEIVEFFDCAPYLIEHARRRLEIYKTEPRFEVIESGVSS